MNEAGGKGAICRGKERDKRVCVISFLDIQTMGLNGVQCNSYKNYTELVPIRRTCDL